MSAATCTHFLAESPYFDYDQSSGKGGLFCCVRAAANDGVNGGPPNGPTTNNWFVAECERDLNAPSAWHQWFMDDAEATTAPFMKHDRIHAEFLS
jgi:hypothetical protein